MLTRGFFPFRLPTARLTNISATPQKAAPTGVTFKKTWASPKVKISAASLTVAGTGAAIAGVDIQQDRCYWEVELTAFDADSGASFAVGVARRKALVPPKRKKAGATQSRGNNLAGHALGDGKLSWALKSASSTCAFAEGDVIGVAYDGLTTGKPTLHFYQNGVKLPGASIVIRARGVSGALAPAVAITAGGAKLTGNFSVDRGDFTFPPPAKYEGIIPAKSML